MKQKLNKNIKSKKIKRKQAPEEIPKDIKTLRKKIKYRSEGEKRLKKVLTLANKNEIKTMACCKGHRKAPGSVYVYFSIDLTPKEFLNEIDFYLEKGFLKLKNVYLKKLIFLFSEMIYESDHISIKNEEGNIRFSFHTSFKKRYKFYNKIKKALIKLDKTNFENDESLKENLNINKIENSKQTKKYFGEFKKLSKIDIEDEKNISKLLTKNKARNITGISTYEKSKKLENELEKLGYVKKTEHTMEKEGITYYFANFAKE